MSDDGSSALGVAPFMQKVQTGQVRRIAGALSQYVGTGDGAKAVRRGAPEGRLTLFCRALTTLSSLLLLLRWRMFRAVQLASLPGCFLA